MKFDPWEVVLILLLISGTLLIQYAPVSEDFNPSISDEPTPSKPELESKPIDPSPDDTYVIPENPNPEVVSDDGEPVPRRRGLFRRLCGYR